MKNIFFHSLTLIITAFLISFFVMYFPNIDYRYIFFFFLFLLILNIVTPIQNLVFFAITTFSILIYFYPLLKSVLFVSMPNFHFSADIVTVIIISIFFLKISTDSKIKSRAIFISVIASTIIYFAFRVYIPYENFLGFTLLLFTSVIFLYLSWDGNFIFQKGALLSQLLLFVVTVSLLLLPGLISRGEKQNIGLVESKWCSTNGNFRDDYTMKSSYSYSLMKEMINNKHHVVWIKHYSDLDKDIESLNVLFIMTPVKPFSAKYVSLIEKFVSHGGTLVAIADHTDLYGHATVLNELLRPYGVKINNVALFKPKNSHAFINIKGMQFDKLQIKTPSSLSLFKPGYVWAWANQWLSEKGDYSKPNFFGDLRWSSDDLYGNWPIGASIKHHKGQVVVFCDSTIFANFALFQPNYLTLLGNMIDGNCYVSHASFYGGIVTLIILIACFINKLPQSFLSYFSFILILLSCSYYQQIFRPESMYLNNRLDVYCDQRIIQEPQPNQIPQSDHFSTAYSDIARSGLYPFYRGSKIISKSRQPSLLITTYDDFIYNLSNKVGEKTKVIILDQIPDENIFGFKEKTFSYKINSAFNKFVRVQPFERNYYTHENLHTMSWKNISILASYGILNDRFIGNWWINNDISPYRHYMLSSFYKWLTKNVEIKPYKYPPLGLIPDKGKKNLWHFKTETAISKSLYLYVHPNSQSFVYCGSGIWALYSSTDANEFLLGGPELSDDLLTSGMNRWAAERESTLNQ